MRSFHIRRVRRALAVAAAVGALATVGTGYAKADIPFRTCPGDTVAIVAGSPTTCEFAYNVKWAYYAHPQTYIQAYSPVTGETYAMSCQTGYIATLENGWQKRGVLCLGGRGAAVIVL